MWQTNWISLAFINWNIGLPECVTTTWMSLSEAKKKKSILKSKDANLF